MKDSWIIGILSVINLIFMLMMFAAHLEPKLKGHNDFAAFYSGAKLLDTGNLYDSIALRTQEELAIGISSGQHGYIRFPFHAAFVWPLSRLPYMTAYTIWEMSLILSTIAFVILWRPPGGGMNVLLVSMSFPVLAGIANGQDTLFLLLFLTGVVIQHRRGSKFLAGAILSLCAIKFHLFLLVPLLIAARREWCFARGFLAGGGVLAIVSFAAAGWNWPLELVTSALNPQFSPRTLEMANLHGVMANVPAGGALEVAIGIAVAIAVWVICRRAGFEYGLAAVLIGGFTLSVHAYLPDLVVTLPAVLILIARSQSKAVKVVAFTLALPPIHLLFFVGFPLTITVLAVSLTAIALMTREVLRGPIEADSIVAVPATADSTA